MQLVLTKDEQQQAFVADLAAMLAKLPRWMIFNDGVRRNFGIEGEGRVKEDVKYLVAAYCEIRDDDLSPFKDDILNELPQLLFNTNAMRVRAKPEYRSSSLSCEEYPYVERCIKECICLFMALEQRLGMVNLKGTIHTDEVWFAGISDEVVYQMLATNAWLIYVHCGITPNTKGFARYIFSASPIRRYGFCNHFDYMLSGLVNITKRMQIDFSDAEMGELLPFDEAHHTALTVMREVHTTFLLEYYQAGRYDAIAINQAAEVATEWLDAKVDDKTFVPGVVAHMVDMVERRLCNWNLN